MNQQRDPPPKKHSNNNNNNNNHHHHHHHHHHHDDNSNRKRSNIILAILTHIPNNSNNHPNVHNNPTNPTNPRANHFIYNVTRVEPTWAASYMIHNFTIDALCTFQYSLMKCMTFMPSLNGRPDVSDHTKNWADG